MTLQLIATRGLPASGKTTWARQWVDAAPNRARINRDDLREQLFGQPAPLPYELEEIVTKVEESAVRDLLRAGTSVVVDATHLKHKYLKRWVRMAERMGAEFSVLDLTDTPLDVCLQRDSDRRRAGNRGVGPEVIRDMHARLKSQKGSLNLEVDAPDPYVYEPKPHLRTAWIFDVDGTLAHMNGRSPYDVTKYREDLPNKNLARIATALDWMGDDIVVLSGRDARYMNDLTWWLVNHGIKHDAIFMRPAEDTRNDAIVKQELFREHVADRWHVLGVFDDRDRVVEMWRRIGLQCFQVAPGDF